MKLIDLPNYWYLQDADPFGITFPQPKDFDGSIVLDPNGHKYEFWLWCMFDEHKIRFAGYETGWRSVFLGQHEDEFDLDFIL